jgi:hypothetical protein
VICDDDGLVLRIGFGEEPGYAADGLNPRAGGQLLSRRRAASYFASTVPSDNTLPRYNVNTFLNSATTRTFSLGSASS